MKKLYASMFALTLLVTPAVAMAQGADLGNIKSLVFSLGQIINLLVPIVFTLALLAFFWGLAIYIFQAGSDDGKDKGRRIMVGGIIALFVMASIWGIVAFLGDALGLQGNLDQEVPGVNNNIF